MCGDTEVSVMERKFGSWKSNPNQKDRKYVFDEDVVIIWEYDKTKIILIDDPPFKQCAKY